MNDVSMTSVNDRLLSAIADLPVIVWCRSACGRFTGSSVWSCHWKHLTRSPLHSSTKVCLQFPRLLLKML